MIKQEESKYIFNFYPAKGEFIGVLSIPHSGEELPSEFRPYLSDNWDNLMQDVDYKVHELVDIEKLQTSGISVIKSNIIRTAIDLNRAKDKCLLNWLHNSKGVKIVNSSPSPEEAKVLIEKYYSPYYEMLKTLILELQTTMNIPSFVDLHSMPGVAEDYHLKINPDQDKVRPDFCISDISGISCEPSFIDNIVQNLSSSYSKVYKNNPYFGGNVTRFLNATYTPLNNIQIEISRGIYMDETNKTLKTQAAEGLKDRLTESLILFYQTQFSKNKKT